MSPVSSNTHQRLDSDLGDAGIKVARYGIYRKARDLPQVADRMSDKLRDRFPWKLRMRNLGTGKSASHRIGSADAPFLDKILDLIIWPEVNGQHKLSGGAVKDDDRPVDAKSSRAAVLRMLAEAHFSKGATRGVSCVEIEEVIHQAKETQDPAQVILGIQRKLNTADAKRILPRGSDHSYRFGDDAKIALVGEPDTVSEQAPDA